MDEQPSIQLGRQQQDELMRNVQIMNEVAKRLKQIPELPSEIPKDNHPLTKVEFPDEGEVFTYMQDYDYPYRGYPYYEFVERIDVVKKLSRSLQSGFYHGLKSTKLRWLLIPLIPILGRSVFWAFTYSFHRLVERTPIRVNRFSQFVQEVYRAFSVAWSDETSRVTELRKMLRDIECMILEFDNAYRFRAQDLAGELNKEALRQNPIREICRLIDIWIEREKVVDVKNSWRLLQLFVKYYLRFDRPLQNIFVRTLLELDIEKCKLTVEDKYFAVVRVDYVFGFMLKPTTEDQKLIKRTQLQKEYEDQKQQVQKLSTVEHQVLNQLHQNQQKTIVFSPEAAQKIQEQKQLLQQKVNLVIQQNQKEFDQQLDKLETEFMSEEQKDMLTRQKKEMAELDKKFEQKLNTVEANYLKAKALI